MFPPQNILFVWHDDSCRCSEGLVQARFLHVVLVGLRNANTRFALKSLFENTTVNDEAILEGLAFATADECKCSDKFKEK